MAPRLLSVRSLLPIALLLTLSFASDPDPLQDFCITDTANKQMIFLNGFACKNPIQVVPADFKSPLLKNAGNTSNPAGVSVNLASAATFGGLNTQGLSFARIDYAEGGLVPPHVHPRASEVLFVVQGKLSVGFVDTNNTLFAETLEAGDLFVFPRGLVHYILNVGKGPALSFSGLNSQNPGASLLPKALFASKPPIPDTVLEKAFQLSGEEVDHLKNIIGKN